MRTSLAGGLLAAAFACGLSATAAAQTKLTYGSYVPSTHVINQDGIVPMAEHLEKASNGALKMELFPGGAIAGGKGAVDQIRDGLVDSGLIVDAYVTRELPTSAMLTELGMVGTDSLVMTGATNEYQLVDCEPCKKDLKEHGIMAMAYYATAPYMLLCNKEVKSLDDMKGLKVRATSGFGVMVKNMGGVPVNIASNEVYEAMQRGQADCTVGADAWLKSYTLWDVAKYVLDFPIGTYHSGLVFAIGADSWKKLPEEQKALIRDYMPKLVRTVAVGYLNEAKEAREGAAPHGVKFVPADPSFADAFKKLQEAEVGRVVEASQKKGVKNPEPIVKGYMDKVAKWTAIVAEINGDPDKFEEALRREIYSKVKF